MKRWTLLLLLGACAAPTVKDEKQTKSGIFVGHSDSGKVLLAATHYDAMNGQAVAVDDLGVSCGEGAMECKRETTVGTHFPDWVCRCKSENEQDRSRTQDLIQEMTRSNAGKAVK